MALIAITILVHGYGTTLWIGYLLRHYLSADHLHLVMARSNTCVHGYRTTESSAGVE
jgi:hypothetical protein